VVETNHQTQLCSCMDEKTGPQREYDFYVIGEIGTLHELGLLPPFPSFFFFFAVLEFKLSASGLLGSCSAT
jgi:hypothetical protein